MKYECIKIDESIGKAYLLDTETGKVYRTQIEDFPNSDKLNNAIDKIQDGWHGVATKEKKTKKLPVYEEEQEVVEDDTLKIKKPKAMIPPGLGGVFLPPDTPGAAVERRVI